MPDFLAHVIIHEAVPEDPVATTAVDSNRSEAAVPSGDGEERRRTAAATCSTTGCTPTAASKRAPALRSEHDMDRPEVY